MSDEQKTQVVQFVVDGWEEHKKTITNARKGSLRSGDVTKLLALPGATAQGNAALSIVGKCKDGTTVMLGITMRLAMQALTLFRQHFGIEGDGRSPPEHNALTTERLNAAMMIILINEREGSEVTFDIDQINAFMQDTKLSPEVSFSEDGKKITLRTKRSE